MRALPRGGSKLGCWIVAIALGLLWGGGQGLYTGLMNLSPTEMTAADYSAKKPKALWLKLKDCKLDLPRAAVHCYLLSDTINELFIPVRVEDPEGSGKAIQVLFATKDHALIDTAQKIKALKTKEDAVAFALAHADELYPRRTISGLIRYGIELDDSERAKLASLNQRLAPDFVILDDGKSPELAFSIMAFASGLLVLYALIKGSSAKPKTVTAAADPAPPSGSPGLPGSALAPAPAPAPPLSTPPQS